MSKFYTSTLTVLTVRNTGQPAGFSAVVNLLIAPMMRRAMRKDLTRLKQVLEAGSRGPGPS